MNLGGLVPCWFCERDGGRTMFGKKWPKAPAVAPFLPEQKWPVNPACATHGTQLAAYSHLVKAPLAAVAFNLEAVENAAVLWNEMPRVVPPHHPTQKVAPEGPSLPSIAVVDEGPRPLAETLTDILSLGTMDDVARDAEVAALPSRDEPPPMTPPEDGIPPMTPAEEAEFDSRIKF